MAKTKEQKTENVAAALEQLDAASVAVGKAKIIVQTRIDNLETENTELESRLEEAETSYTNGIQALKDQHLREKTVLETRLAVCEEKLRKIQVTLS